MNELLDLQAQVVALRVATEAAWLSLLGPASDPAGDARRLGEQHIAAIGQLDANTDAQRELRDAVIGHTAQLWGSIAWQLESAGKQAAT